MKRITGAQLKSVVRKRNKFGAKATVYNGRRYHSAAEARYARELDAQLRAGTIMAWETQIHVPLWIGPVLICHLIADFNVFDGVRSWLVEIKGRETESYKLKLKLFRALNPNRDYRILYVVGNRFVPEAEYRAMKKAASATNRKIKAAAKKGTR